MSNNEDDEEVCSACNKNISWLTKSCLIYSCYNPVCSKCKCCKDHSTLLQLKNRLSDLEEWWEKYNRGKEYIIDHCGLYVNEKSCLVNMIISMEIEIANWFKILQQVHNKRLPDDVSKLITSYLY